MTNPTSGNEGEVFQREERYIVVKRKHLTPFMEASIRNLLSALELTTVECVVVESDWPEYESVWGMIEDRVKGTHTPTPAPVPHDLLAGTTGWQPIETCEMWQVEIVTDGENAAVAQKAETDFGEPYWSIDPDVGLEWEPTSWIHLPNLLAAAPDLAAENARLRAMLDKSGHIDCWTALSAKDAEITALREAMRDNATDIQEYLEELDWCNVDPVDRGSSDCANLRAALVRAKAVSK